MCVRVSRANGVVHVQARAQQPPSCTADLGALKRAKCDLGGSEGESVWVSPFWMCPV